MKKPYFLLLIFTVLLSCRNSDADNDEKNFMLGSEVLIHERISLLENKNIAVITNRTAVLSNGKHIIDAFLEKGILISKIFTPEHGFGADDKYYSSGYDIPVVSLYGSRKSFGKNDLDGIDAVIYDIQDLGVRYYTYTSTLYLTMQDALSSGADYYVCDRPSVGDLNYVSGFMLDPVFESFVGMIPVPVIYGMTTGELSLYLNSKMNSHASKFEVIPMKGYGRNTDYKYLDLPWVKPSPNIPSLESARLYPALCFIEGVNISEGRCTQYPFQQFGAPFINSSELVEVLDSYNLPGVEFAETVFTPSDEFNVSSYPSKYMNQRCYGVKLILTDISLFKPVETNIAILCALKKVTPELSWINGNFIDKLSGTDKLRKMVDNGSTYDEIIKSWSEEVNSFMSERSNFLLYP